MNIYAELTIACSSVDVEWGRFASVGFLEGVDDDEEVIMPFVRVVRVVQYLSITQIGSIAFGGG